MKYDVPMVRSRFGPKKYSVSALKIRWLQLAWMKPQVTTGMKSRRRRTWYGRSRLRSMTLGALNAITLTMPMMRSRANEAGAEFMAAQDATSRGRRHESEGEFCAS